MKDFEAARALFKDVCDEVSYFKSVSASVVFSSIGAMIEEDDTSFIFLLGHPGVGKTSMLLHLYHYYIQERPVSFLKTPYEKDLCTLLKNAEDKTLFFIDEAQLLTDKQWHEFISCASVHPYRCVFALHQKEGRALLKSSFFKQIPKRVIEYGTLQTHEILQYIQRVLLEHSHADIASLFSLSDAKIIARYTKGNFRTLKKFTYTLMKLLAYTYAHKIEKQMGVNRCTLTMSAIEARLLNDTSSF